MIPKKLRFVAVCLAFLLAAGCAAIPEKPVFRPTPGLYLVPDGQWPLLSDDMDAPSLKTAIERSLAYYNRLPERTPYRFGTAAYTAGELKESLLEFAAIMEDPEPWETKARKIREHFDLYRSSGSDDRGKIIYTGYYEPVLEGSLEKTDDYRYPLYRQPEDALVINLEKFRKKYKGDRLIGRIENGEVIPYYSREEIDTAGYLEGRGLEIAWVKDPVELFFLHVQGSGMICLPDSRCIQVSYARANGRPFSGVGRVLIDRGKLASSDLSLQGVKKYLRAHPDEVTDILNQNESYVFFRIVEEGPVGSLGVIVTGGRSIATDSTLFPRGALAFIRTRKPVVDEKGQAAAWESFSRFVLNQDTGGVITGPGRVDLFCGRGESAENIAGYMKEEGELYFLVKKKAGSASR
jgi:membrane-bound lytic murein transglycosylase A